MNAIRLHVRSLTHTWPERALMSLAWRLPRRLAYMCAVRVIAHATTGEYADTVVPNLRAMDALQRWAVDAPTEEVR